MKLSLLETASRLQYEYAGSWSCILSDGTHIGYTSDEDTGRIHVVGNDIKPIYQALVDNARKYWEIGDDIRITTKHPNIGKSVQNITMKGKVVAVILAANPEYGDGWCFGAIFTNPLLPIVAS